MALAANVTDVDHSRRRARRVLGLTFSGNYATGGDALDLTAVTNTNWLAKAHFGQNPLQGAVLNAPDGYGLEIVPGATLSTWKVKVLTASGAELAAGAYPAGLTGDSNAALEFISRTNL